MVIRSEGASQAGMSMRVMASPVCLQLRTGGVVGVNENKNKNMVILASGEPTLRPGEGARGPNATEEILGFLYRYQEPDRAPRSGSTLRPGQGGAPHTRPLAGEE